MVSENDAARRAGVEGSPAPSPASANLPLPRARASVILRRAHDLPPEHPVKGPALIEDPWATTLVYPGQTGILDRFGNVLIEVSK